MIAQTLDKLRGGGLGARARRGALLTILQFGGRNLLRLISNLVLTRLLFPEAFGLMALVQVVQAGVFLFSDLGIQTSIIQHKRGDDPVFLNTAWTLQIIRGCLLYALIVLAAPYAAAFFEEPILQSLLYVTGLSAIISGFAPVRSHVASRNLELGRITIVGLVSQVLNIIVTVTFAWWLQSVWALAIGTLTGLIFSTLLTYVIVPGIKDRLCLEWNAVKDMVGFGMFVLISTSAMFLLNHADRAILGKSVGVELLGIYAIAMTLATLPFLVGRSLAVRIVFPLYSRRPPKESAENRQKLSQARYTMTLALFAAAIGLVVIGDPLVRFLYDDRYDLAGGICVLIVLGFMPSMITMSYDNVLLADGRSDLHAVLAITMGLMRLAALYFGVVYFGIFGVALAPAVASLMHYPVLLWLVRPYKVWDPGHDVVFAGVTVAVFVLGFWLHGDAISKVPGFEALVPQGGAVSEEVQQ